MCRSYQRLFIRTSFFCWLLLSVLLSLPGGISQAVEAPSMIRFGVSSTGIGGRPILGGVLTGNVAAKGLLEEEFKADGITIQWSFNKGAGPQTNEQFANNQIDFAWQGDLPSIIGRAAGIKTRIILAGGRGGNLYLAVPVGSPAHTINDLVGKRMVVSKGTALQLFIGRILDQYGLREGEFKTINLDATASMAAFLSGDIDCLWGTTSLFDLRDRGVVRFIYSTREPSPDPAKPNPTVQTVVLVSDAFERAHPLIVQRVVNVFVRESEWASRPENREQLFAIWERSGTPIEHYRTEFGDLPLAGRLSPTLDASYMSAYQQAAESALAHRLIRTPVSFTGWAAPQYVTQALTTLGLESRWTDPVNQLTEKSTP